MNSWRCWSSQTSLANWILLIYTINLIKWKKKKITLFKDHMARSLSQHQAVINWTLMISLKFSLLFLPNSSCQLYTRLQVTTAALARRLCWYGCMDRWMDEKKERLTALIGLGIIKHSADVFFLVLFVYQVVLLRHGCQDLMTERRCQTVDTDWKRNEATNDLWPSPYLFKPPPHTDPSPPTTPPNNNKIVSKSMDFCSIR